jgi:ankyrin repeat protein
MWKKLFSAAVAGDRERVRDMLAGGRDAVRELGNPKTGDSVLLPLCREAGCVDMIRFVLDDCCGEEGGRSLNELANYDGKTMLHEAAQFKNVEAVRLLLSRCAQVDALKRADWTPLMLACTKAGNGEVVSLLLDAGANPRLVNKDGWTPFLLASRATEDDLEVMEKLFRVGGRDMMHTKSHNLRTPLHTAALNCRPKAVGFILERSDGSAVNAKDSCGSTPLMDAVRGGSVDIVESLIATMDGGVDLAAQKDGMGRNVLHIAAHLGQAELVRHFISAPHLLDPRSISNTDAMTAVHWSALEGQFESAVALLEADTELVRVRDGKGRTAEDIAVAGNFVKTVEAIRKFY